MPIKTNCLLCNRRLLDNQTFAQVVNHDELCSGCRRSLKAKKRTLQLETLKMTAFHLYDDAMSECLIQYKECMDEALYDVFLFEVRDWIHLHYRNCVFLCAPSSERAMERRGFHHVVKMFESCGVEIIDCFKKTDDISQKAAASLAKRKEIERNLTVNLKMIPMNRRIVLIDDVATTGSTLLTMQRLIGTDRCKEALCAAVHSKLLREFDKKRKRKQIYFLCRKGGKQ